MFAAKRATEKSKWRKKQNKTKKPSFLNISAQSAPNSPSGAEPVFSAKHSKPASP